MDDDGSWSSYYELVCNVLWHPQIGDLNRTCTLIASKRSYFIKWANYSDMKLKEYSKSMHGKMRINDGCMLQAKQRMLCYLLSSTKLKKCIRVCVWVFEYMAHHIKYLLNARFHWWKHVIKMFNFAFDSKNGSQSHVISFCFFYFMKNE